MLWPSFGGLFVLSRMALSVLRTVVVAPCICLLAVRMILVGLPFPIALV